MSEETIIEDQQVDEAEATVEETPAEAAAPLSVEEQLAAAQAEAADYYDRWLRSQAEFANARKRMEKQRVELYQSATADLATRLLPVVDDFERALATVPDEIGTHSWYEGVELVYRKLTAILEGLNVAPIEAVGQPFDPNLHEAIAQEPSDEYESGVVIRELQKGYALGDRVVRPSLVCVAA